MRRRALGQIILGLVIIAVLVFVVVNRDAGDDLESATTIAPAAATTGTAGTTSSEATTTAAATAATPTTAPPTAATTTAATTTATAAPVETTAATATTAASTTTTLTDTASPEYANGLAEARVTLALLVEEMEATNRVFDNRFSTGPDFRMTSDAISAFIAGVRALADHAAAMEVPPALADLHKGSGGPIERAARLVPLAEAVLAGLRLPYPEDGTARRTAVAGYSAASEGFNTAIDDLIDRVRDDAEELGVASTEEDSDGLAEDAALYLEGLSGLAGTATRLLGDLNDANQSWEEQRAIGASYRQTEAALLDILDRTRSLEATVRNLSPPDDLAGLHSGPGGPIELAGELAALAEEVLAGLRIPEPDDGADRRAAAAAYAAVAERFDAIADQLIRQGR